MKALKIVGIVLGTVVVVGIAWLMIADFGSYKPEIEAAVTDATGREFRIQGELEIRALPSPTARMQDVTLANARSSDQASMLEVGSLSVELGFWSLLFGPVVVKDFQLHDVSVLLETAEDGTSNLDFDVPDDEPPAAAETEGDSWPQIELRNVDISNVTVTMRQPGADDTTFALENLTIVTNENDQQLIDGVAEFLDRPITLSGTVSDHQADIDATFGNIRYHSVTQHQGTEADVDITVSSLADVGEFFEITDLPAGDLTMSGHLALSGDSLVLNDVTVGIGTATLTINGELDSAAAEGQLELSVNCRSREPQAFEPLDHLIVVRDSVVI